MCPQTKSRASRKISFEESSVQQRPEVDHWVKDSFATYFGVRPEDFALVEESAGYFVQQFYKQHQEAFERLVYIRSSTGGATEENLYWSVNPSRCRKTRS